MHNDILDTVLVGGKDKNTATPAMKDNTANMDEAQCPVDHKTRDTWIRQARATASTTRENDSQPVHAAKQLDKAAAEPLSGRSRETHSSWSWSKSWASSWSGSRNAAAASPTSAADTGSGTTVESSSGSQLPSALGTDRVVSTIPRSSSPGPSSCPVNHEQETGTSAGGNWMYPSEKMFFDAMKRKGHDSARVTDMKTVVPIHNAVNERAWAEILEWEKPYVAPANASCGGPRLHSFAGLSESMTPKARLNTLLGYTAPFDRHDWIVDRCGTKVEYVIDFYAGRAGENRNGKVNFYLDVRPKLNSWEGIRMRAARTLGLA